MTEHLLGKNEVLGSVSSTRREKGTRFFFSFTYFYLIKCMHVYIVSIDAHECYCPKRSEEVIRFPWSCSDSEF